MARDSVLSRGEWLALAAAIAIAHLFYWRIVNYPSDFDARNYLDIAIDINRNGLFSKFYYSDSRTYAYPLLLAHLIRIADLAHVPVSALVFETQLALYLAAAYILRRQVANVWPGFARWAFIGVVLNVFALSYTPESLTESVSLSLIVLAAACVAALIANPLHWRALLAGGIVAGLAVVVRPANMFLLFAWIVAVAALCIVGRPSPRSVAAMIVAVSAGVLLPMLPQYANNLRHYAQHTPLVAARLAHNQQIWGIGYIKYATALPPVPNPS